MTEPNWTERPLRRVLLATDLSARCDRALDRAAALAGIWQAELIAVHALEQPEDLYGEILGRQLPSWGRNDPAFIAKQQLRHDMMQTGQDFRVIVERGEPVDIILRSCEAQACDLIVTGIARDETLGRFTLGTTVDRLLRSSRVPLLVVKQRVRSPYNKVVVATDFSSSSQYALRAAVALLPHQSLALFHAYRAPWRD